MKNKYVKIEGIHCNHCIDLITNELLENKNIKEVKIKNNIAYIKYEKKLNNKELIKIINELDYITKEEYISDNLKDIDNKIRLKELTGEIVKANLDQDGNIIINESDITEEVIYISYEYEGVTIGLLAVRDSEGKVIVVVNTCQACGRSLYAYFVQVGDKIQCQSCGNLFNIDDLDNLSPDGCNPIGIEERNDVDGKIIIGTEQLKQLRDKFENWKGPKNK